MDGSESKRVIFNSCYLDESKSKIVHISINKNEVKDAMNETNDEEPSVTDNSVIIAPRYFKIFEYGKNFLNKLDATCERACMATLRERYDIEVIK